MKPIRQHRSFWVQLGIFLLTVMGYSVAFMIFYPSRGASIAALSVLPVMVSGWYFGLRVTLVIGLLTIPLNTLLFNIVGNPGWDALLQQGGPGSLAVLLVGAIVGRFRDLDEKIRQELTKRKEAEEALKERERQLRAIIETEPECVKLVDVDGTLLEMNPAGLKIIEADDPEQAIGKSFYPIIAPSCRQTFSDLNERVFCGESVVAEFEIIGMKGARRWMETHAVPLKDNQGQVKAQLAITRDVTERKQIVDELTALYNATSCLFKSDNLINLGQQIVQAIVQEFTQADCGLMLLDKTQGKVLRLARAGSYHVNTEVPLHLNGPGLVAKALRLEEPVLAPDVRKDPDYVANDPRTRSELVVPLHASKGLLGVLDLQSDKLNAFSQPQQRVLVAFAERAAAAIEIMQLYEELNRYAAELEWRVDQRTGELQRTKARVETILNNSTDGIVLACPDGVIQQTNSAFDHLFADHPSISLPRSLIDLVEPDQRDLLIETLAGVAQSQQATQLDLVCQRNTGNWSASVAIAPVWEPDTGEFAVICNFHDITEHKRIEEDLRVALEKEKKLNELKSRFSSMVTHEFRTPLAVIQTSSDLLKRYSLKMTEESKLKYIDSLQSQVKHMVEMLDHILILSKAETVGLEFNPEPVDLSTVCREIVEEIQSTATINRLKFSADCRGLPVFLDLKLLRQMLTNLLSNALKYSPQGGTVHLDVSCDEHQAIFHVKDEGIGIPEDDHEHLFDSFHRAENASTISGTGLGLTIVKLAVEAHGGTIAFESAVGVGTTFTVILPVSIPASSRAASF